MTISKVTTMRFSHLMVSAVLIGLSGTALAQDSDIQGTWVSEGGHATFEVTVCGDGTQICADLVGLSEDTVAPELQPFVGQRLLNGASQTGDNTWEASVMLGISQATGTITLVTPDRIEAKGCIAQDCRTLYFERAASPS